MSKKQIVTKKRVVDEKVVDPQQEATKPINEEESSSPLGVLNIISRSIESIPIKEIKKFELIPDFIIPTESEYPIIIRTDLGNSCIEGWSLIEEALAEGEDEIICEVDELETHSDTELCLRKAGMRSRTKGGKYIFAEMVRNTRDLMTLLMSKNKGLQKYGHGGRRFGEGFSNNREDDIVYILSLRLGKDKKTINNYISHSEYINDDVLEALIARKATKEFFEKFQVKKRIEVKNQLGSGNISFNRITELISKLILEEFEKFTADEEDNENTPSATAETPNEAPVAIDSESTDSEGNDEDDDDNPIAEDSTPISPSEATPVNNEAPVTVETIKLQIVEVSKRIVDEVSKEVSLIEMKKHLQNEVHIIMGILARIDSLSSAEK
jgi:hypothetical protein